MSISLQPVDFASVRFTGGFWSERLRVNRRVSVPLVYRRLQETGRIGAFNLDWRPGREPVPHHFWDSDVYKWVEAASYVLAERSNPSLAARLQELAGRIAAAQQPDGYLNVYYTVVEPKLRWTNLMRSHELYTAGHFFEAAVAYHRATGDSRLLEAAQRFADLIGRVFGPGPEQRPGYDGHPEVELALVGLYRATGRRRYLELARFFLEERGRPPHFWDRERRERNDPAEPEPVPYERLQAHRPLLEQTEAVGHAVRAVYLYSGLADLAAETGDRRYRRTLDRLWESVALRKLYLTGGIGALAVGEQFSGDYHLPNETAYAETCASIGLIFWARRLLDLDCDRRYAEVMEAALYNGALSGVSLDGRRFFYVNPLASEGRHHRQEFFGCACCPPNLLRLLASLGRYFYSAAEDELCVHLYGAGAARLEISGVRLRFVQETDYPWEGRVGLEISPERPVRFRLRLRVPEWCRNWSLSINGTSLSGRLSRGYLLLDRTWRPGDRLALDLEMKPELVHAHPAVGTAAGCAALRRGPLVYCLEGVDNPGLPSIFIDSARSFRPVRVESGPLKGLVLLKGRGWRASRAGWEKRLYSDRAPKLEPAPVIAVPYFVWDNRAAGPMRVWLPRPPAGS